MPVNGPSLLAVVVNKALYMLLVSYSSCSYCSVWITITAVSHSMSGVNLHALWWPCQRCFAIALHAICFMGIAGLSSLFFLIFNFKQTCPPQTLSNSSWRWSHCFLDSLEAPPPPSLSLSMHGIQIISRASLCCCMEGMGVFELDLLDNTRSAQISFHARLFHAERVLILGLRKVGEGNLKPIDFNVSHLCKRVALRSGNKINLWMSIFFSVSSSIVASLPIWLLRPFTGRGTGRAESRLQQTGSSGMLLLFMTWWTGLIGGHSGKADRLEGGDQIWVFVLISADFLSLSELGGIQPQMLGPEQRRHAMVTGYRLRSDSRDSPYRQLLHQPLQFQMIF